MQIHSIRLGSVKGIFSWSALKNWQTLWNYKRSVLRISVTCQLLNKIPVTLRLLLPLNKAFFFSSVADTFSGKCNCTHNWTLIYVLCEHVSLSVASKWQVNLVSKNRKTLHSTNLSLCLSEYRLSDKLHTKLCVCFSSARSCTVFLYGKTVGTCILIFYLLYRMEVYRSIDTVHLYSGLEKI